MSFGALSNFFTAENVRKDNTASIVWSPPTDSHVKRVYRSVPVMLLVYVTFFTFPAATTAVSPQKWRAARSGNTRSAPATTVPVSFLESLQRELQHTSKTVQTNQRLQAEVQRSATGQGWISCWYKTQKKPMAAVCNVGLGVKRLIWLL